MKRVRMCGHAGCVCDLSLTCLFDRVGYVNKVWYINRVY